MAKTLEELEQEIAALEERSRLLEKSASADDRAIERMRDQQAALSKYNPEYARLTAEIEKRTAAQAASNLEARENVRISKERQKELEELAKAVAKLTQSYEQGKNQTDAFFASFTSPTTALGKFGGKLQEIGSKDRGQLKAFIGGMTDGANLLQNLGAVGVKVIDMFAEFGIQQDKVIAQFRAQTGAGEEFNEVIRDTALANIQAGVGLEDTIGAITALKNEFTDFTYLNREQQNEVAETTTLLNKLGFSFSTQASIMQTATQAMNMDVDEAQDLLIDLASTARSLGVDVNELGAQFDQNIDFIVRFGEDGQEVFEEMAVAAKALGLEMGSLIKITDSFKTFDEGARIVGRFNAILGGPFLNSMDMLNAAYEDPIEGIKMLREGFDQAGRSIEDLGGAELEALSSALGISTSETKKLLGSTNEELEIQRIEQEQLAETAAAAQDVMTQLGNAFKQVLADAKPFIDLVVIPLMEGIGSIASFLGDAESAMSSFVRVGMAAAGIAAIIAAPLTAGTSLPLGTALLATAGIGVLGGGVAAALTGGAPSGGGTSGAPTPGFATGGTIATQQAVVHPGELIVTGGQGSEVISAQKFDELIMAVKNQSAAPQEISVYIGQEKIDQLVVKGINSPAGRQAFNPFGNG
jgi:hypothetical protein